MHLLLLAEQTRNLHEVAQRLNVTQPAVTKSLQELERILGFELFVRTPHGLKPTAYTRAATRMAREIVASVENAQSAFAQIDRRDHAHLVIGGIYSAVPRVIPQAISELHALRPEIATTVVPGSTNVLVPALLASQLHVVVGVLDDDARHVDLAATSAGTDSFVLISALGHPLNGVEGVGLREVLSEPWIIGVQPVDLAARLARMRKAHGVTAKSPDLVTESWATTLPLLLSGRCVTPVSQEMARYCRGMGLVDILPVELDFPSFDIGIITRRADSLSESVAQIGDLLIASVRRAWPPGGAIDARTIRSDMGALRAVA